MSFKKSKRNIVWGWKKGVVGGEKVPVGAASVQFNENSVTRTIAGRWNFLMNLLSESL